MVPQNGASGEVVLAEEGLRKGPSRDDVMTPVLQLGLPLKILQHLNIIMYERSLEAFNQKSLAKVGLPLPDRSVYPVD